MSPIAKKFLIAALIYLVLGLLAQTVTLFDNWLGFNPLAYTASTATQQILWLGWLTQLGLALIYDRWIERSVHEPEHAPNNETSPHPNPLPAGEGILDRPPSPSGRGVGGEGYLRTRLGSGDYEAPHRTEKPKIVNRIIVNRKYPKGTMSKIVNPTSVFLLFNLGLPLIIIGQPGLALFGGSWLGAAAATGGLLQLSAGLLLAWQAWSALKKP